MFYSHLKSMSLLLVVSLGFMKGGGLTFTALRRDRADGFIETYYGSYSAESFNLRSGPSRGGGAATAPHFSYFSREARCSLAGLGG